VESILLVAVSVIVFVVAGIAFFVWLVARVLGWIIRAAVGGPARQQPQGNLLPAAILPCPQPRCRAGNPGHARFCRRCGRSVANAGAPGRAAPQLRYVA
jgi:hypothetical protein